MNVSNRLAGRFADKGSGGESYNIPTSKLVERNITRVLTSSPVFCIQTQYYKYNMSEMNLLRLVPLCGMNVLQHRGWVRG